MSGPLIFLDRIGKSFDGGRSFAVRNASLSIDAGAFLALVGASGSGKTTLMKTINRLIEPDEGQVLVGGEPVASTDAPNLRRRIGYVFQGIGLFPHLSVAENISITPALLRWPKPEIAARVAELLELVGLPQDYAGRRPHMLSGGERQRVGIARALAARPKIVLMDEPLGAVDPVTRDAIGSAYRALHERLGLTTIMVTHDVQEALILADRIVVMQGGHILAEGTPAQMLSAEADPAAAALMDVPRRHAERIRNLAEAQYPTLDGGGP